MTQPSHLTPRPQFDRRRDRRLLAFLAVIPGVLLMLAAATLLALGSSSGVGLVLLIGHVVTQFIVLLVYGSLVMNDRGLGGPGRALWASAFLFAAPLALPAYYWHRVRVPIQRERRAFATDVSPASA